MAKGREYFILNDRLEPVAAQQLEWARWLENNDNDSKRIVKMSYLAHGFELSTCFIGLDMGHGKRIAPVIYETALFDDQGRERECCRYSTRKEAEEGHEKILKELREKYQAATREDLLKAIQKGEVWQDPGFNPSDSHREVMFYCGNCNRSFSLRFPPGTELTQHMISSSSEGSMSTIRVEPEPANHVHCKYCDTIELHFDGHGSTHTIK